MATNKTNDADNTPEETQVGDDLASLTITEKGMTMTVMHPRTGDPVMNSDKTPMTVTVVGTDSHRYAALRHKQSNEKISKALKAGDTSKAGVTSEKVEADNLALLVHATTDWRITYNGTMPACEPELIEKVYRALPWLRSQVETFVNDRANFLGN